ncbi:MAG TPA: efflux transporter outer membrane subunit [Verrucomicrobiae bacterium]|jgi:multidrug efflux system outer membrane protein|nr:efflux transporter outer membrane subunit [Verrucomicrobiae bacterium]
MRAKLQIITGSALLSLLAACAVGPDYHQPKTTVSAEFGRVGEAQYSTNTPLVQWWSSFNDPLLIRLVQTALTNNHDLRIAAANLNEARALRRQAQFDLLPVPQATAGYTKEQLSPASFPGFTSQPLRASFFDAGFDALWELDLFGRVRRSVESRTAAMEASEASLEAVRVSLTSEIARNYFELRGLQNELAVAYKNVTNQQETVNITRARLEGGRGTELDVARARSILNNTLAIIPPLETSVAEAIHRLGVLTGQQPTALRAELTPPGSLPALPNVVNIGDPNELLRRRPDIRIAERNLAAATANIGVSVADLFPRVTLNGQFGWEASNFSALGTANGEAWSFGPRITWAALDLGHVRARIQAANARAESYLAQYERTVLTSLEEAENALVAFGREQQRLGYLQQSVADSRIAAVLARQRYDAGAVDFLVVLDAERAQLVTEDQFAQSQTRTATALVAVFKALGGS